MSITLSAFSDEAAESAEGQIAAVGRAGLRFLDLRTVDGINISELPIEHAKALRQKLAAANLKVGMFGSPIGKIDIADDPEIDLRRLRHLAELADVLDCRSVRIFSYYNRAGADLEKWRSETFRRFAGLLRVARESALLLYHENELDIFGQMAQQAAEIAAEFGVGADSSLRLIFDFDNYQRAGENIARAFERLQPLTAAFHLKDSVGENHVPVGAGAGQVRPIITRAVADGFSGFMSIEPHLNGSAAPCASGQAFKTCSHADNFSVACAAAVALLKQAGVPSYL